MKSVLYVLIFGIAAIALLFSGCTTAPEEPKEKTTNAVEPEPEAEPEPEEKEPEKVVRTVTLPSKESSYFSDGILDEYTVYVYEEESNNLLEKSLYSDEGALLEKRIYTYENGLLKKEEVFNESGELQTYYTNEYDQSGNLLSESTFDNEGELQLKSVYNYNEEGEKTKWSIFSGSDALFSYTEYAYKNGNFTKAETFTPAGDLDVYFENEYDSAGNMIKSTQYDADGDVLEFRTYEYENGSLVEEIIHRQNGSVERSVQYTNDEQGNPVEIIYKNSSGEIQERLTREYIRREYIEYLEE